jgi:hypothetical protein
MRIVIQLEPDAAREVHALQRTTRGTAPGRLRAAPVFALLEKFGLQLDPVHPGTRDPSLAVYFTIEIADQRTADRLLQDLQQMKVVDAAYLKPEDELP